MTSRTTTPDPDPAATGDHDLYARARDWMFAQGASGWVSEAFGHWVITEIAPHGPVPEPLSRLVNRWNHEHSAASYRDRHGARPAAAGPWSPGDPLPETRPGDDDPSEHPVVAAGPDGEYARQVTARFRATGPVGGRDRLVVRASAGALAYADELLRGHTREDRDAAEAAAAALSFDELVDLERALADRYRLTGGYPAVLDVVETRRQNLAHDHPELWTAHLSVCTGCARRPVDQPDTTCPTCAEQPGDDTEGSAA